MKEIKRALLRVENQRLEVRDHPPYPKDVQIFLPDNREARLRFYNWKIWTLRYHVTMAFIVDVITFAFKNQRRFASSFDEIRFGLPTASVTGEKARRIVEDAILRTYPNGENLAMTRSPQFKPIRGLNYETLEEMVSHYRRAVDARRRHAFKKEVYARPFRRV